MQFVGAKHQIDISFSVNCCPDLFFIRFPGKIVLLVIWFDWMRAFVDVIYYMIPRIISVAMDMMHYHMDMSSDTRES